MISYKDIKKKLKGYWRVLKVTKKPDKQEYNMSAKVTGLGIIIIGTIGFLIYLASNIITGV